MQDFKNKVAVITGAGRGIGRGIAERCVQEGMKIVLAGIGTESLSRTEADLKAQGATVLSVQTDVSNSADIERLAEQALIKFGAVHLLINNAGVTVIKSLQEHTLVDWKWLIDVNLWGVIHGVHTFLPIMIEQDIPCHIVNVSSVAGLITSHMTTSYSVTKHAVVAFSESLHKNMLHTNTKVKVSVFCPGYIQSDIVDAERNRPIHLKNKSDERIGADTEEAKEFICEQMVTAMPALEAADHVFRALKKDQFYILSHPKVKDAVQIRMEDILHERNPKN